MSDPLYFTPERPLMHTSGVTLLAGDREDRFSDLHSPHYSA